MRFLALTLSVGLLTVGWNVAAGRTALQTIQATALVLVLMQVGYAAFIVALALYARRRRRIR